MTDINGLIVLLNRMAEDREGKIRLSPNDISDIAKSLNQLGDYHQKVNSGEILIVDLKYGYLYFSKDNKRVEVISHRKELDGKIVIEIEAK